MTLPRCVLPGQTLMVTRRCLRRTKLLRPDAALNQLYIYCLAVLAARHGVAVHAVVLMSTHEHLIVTDKLGRLPLFLRELHRLVALGVKVLRRWEGAVWDHERPSIVHLRTQQAVIEKLAYIMANPVEAGLVSHASAWPGVRVVPDDLGCARLQAPRPDYYFDQDNTAWPQSATLQLALPELGDLSPEAFRQHVADELEQQEQLARKTVAAKGWAFLGVRGVLKTSPFDSSHQLGADSQSQSQLRSRPRTEARLLRGRRCTPRIQTSLSRSARPMEKRCARSSLSGRYVDDANAARRDGDARIDAAEHRGTR